MHCSRDEILNSKRLNLDDDGLVIAEEGAGAAAMMAGIISMAATVLGSETSHAPGNRGRP
jgi:hypothetical protein